MEREKKERKKREKGEREREREREKGGTVSTVVLSHFLSFFLFEAARGRGSFLFRLMCNTISFCA